MEPRRLTQCYTDTSRTGGDPSPRILGTTPQAQRQRQPATRRVITTLPSGAEATPHSRRDRGAFRRRRHHGYAPSEPRLSHLGPRWHPERDDRGCRYVCDYRGCSAAVPSGGLSRPVSGDSAPCPELSRYDLLLPSRIRWRKGIDCRAGWPVVDHPTPQANEAGCGITTRCSGRAVARMEARR